MDESRITNDNRLQTQQFFQGDGVPARFANRAAPTLDPILRRAFTLDGVAETSSP